MGTVPGSLGLEDGKDVEKSTRIRLGEVVVLQSRRFRVWIGSRLSQYGKSRIVMICWSCQKKIPNNAEFCQHCEAEVVTQPSAEEEAAAASALLLIWVIGKLTGDF